MTATTGLVLLVGGLLLEQQAANGLDSLNAAEFAEVSERLVPMTPQPSAAEIDRLLRPHAEIDASLYFFQVYAPDGALLFRSANLGRTVLAKPLTGQPPNRTTDVPGLGRVRLSEFAIGQIHVQIASSIETAERLVHDYTRMSLALLGGLALVSVGLSWSFAQFVLRPVRVIRETASRISADNFSERIAVPGGRDELAALAVLLNQMLSRLETSFLEVKRFTVDASHELKTPLALIRLSAEHLRSRLAADPEATVTLDNLLEDLARLHRIIESLLFLAKADSGSLPRARDVIVVEQFVSRFVEDAALLAEDQGLRFSVVHSDSGVVRGDTTLLWQLLLNLASNACRAVESDGEIMLESRLDANRWRLIVSDTGPGLPTPQLERVFERFVRYTPVGGSATPWSGQGLGLTICRSIAHLHGGRILAENRPGGRGLGVIVELPLNPT